MDIIRKGKYKPVKWIEGEWHGYPGVRSGEGNAMEKGSLEERNEKMEGNSGTDKEWIMDKEM